jgi:ribosomal protein S27AE
MLPVTIGSILLGLAILVVVGLFLIRPFFKPPPPDEVTSKRQQLTAQKSALLEAVRALEFDHDTGKIPDEEYEQMRTSLMSDAAAVLKALDEMSDELRDEDVYAQIEAAISRIKQQRAPAAGKGTATAVRFCTNCGQGLESDDNFCPRCGQAVYNVQPST